MAIQVIKHYNQIKECKPEKDVITYQVVYQTYNIID